MSEFDWIAKYFAPLANSAGAAHLTDDVAQLPAANRIITTDTLIEAVHFLPQDPIDTVARKLVRVNVSDILAKGARPAEALLTLGWPNDRPETDLARFAEAFGEELAHWGIDLLGGDTVTSPSDLFVSLTLTGTLSEGAKPVRRSGAKPGDTIWVTGEIGWGGVGLEAAKRGEEGEAADRYRVPHLPPIRIADIILHDATASMDISDGLIADVQKLVSASRCSAGLALDAVPLAASIDPNNLDGILSAVSSGDDYQCLFTASEDKTDALISTGLDLHRIGSITAAGGLVLSWRGAPVPIPSKPGFEHG
ncbi:MAG: thiamine-phosphate kinase [Pseudomonadota bacterium]